MHTYIRHTLKAEDLVGIIKITYIHIHTYIYIQTYIQTVRMRDTSGIHLIVGQSIKPVDQKGHPSGAGVAGPKVAHHSMLQIAPFHTYIHTFINIYV